MSAILHAIGCFLSVAFCNVEGPPVPTPPGTLPAPIVAATATPMDLPREIPREVLKYRNMLIREIRVVWGDGEPADTFFGQAHQESRWRADARSPVGALGLAQFMPSTAQWIQGVYPADLGEICPDAGGCPTDPRWSIRALVRYDDRLYRAITGAASRVETWAYTLASYNGGGGWVTRERAISSDRSRWFGATEHACLRRAEFCVETKNYVHRIIEKWAPLYRNWLAR